MDATITIGTRYRDEHLVPVATPTTLSLLVRHLVRAVTKRPLKDDEG